ncbi:MAG: rRNA small subunit methyltransferase B [Geodermatophilaceae bacterium]|nr:rRNA small subunit methyltransferase B [Geodermatophilaceae bacterium]
MAPGSSGTPDGVSVTGRRPAYRPVPSSDPRRVAYDLLRAVAERDAYANLTLPGMLRERGLDERDRALATELGYGTLRAQGSLDAVLGACLDRRLEAVDATLLDVLRLGSYQLLRTRIPTHAAVNTSVDLARTVLTHGQVSVVNAVLRKVSAYDETGWLERVAPTMADDPAAHLAQRYAHPAWIVRAYRDALGGDWPETATALAADDERPRVHLVARPGRIGRDELAALSGGTAGPWSPYAVRLDGGDPGALAPVRDMRAAVQDEGSQLAALALTNGHLDGPDGNWLDLCAGPGGKAALLGALAAERAAAVLAVELQPHRAKLVEQATAGLPVRTEVADGRDPRPPDADRVLVDAPCTGLGALRRRPEARWRRQPSDIPPLARLQRELLTAGLAAARPGGLVAYATCSPHLAETRAVVADVVRRTGAEQLDTRPALPGVPDLGDGPHVQLWPHLHGTDAMFIALLRKGP